jgi:hypothetical protein
MEKNKREETHAPAGDRDVTGSRSRDCMLLAMLVVGFSAWKYNIFVSAKEIAFTFAALFPRPPLHLDQPATSTAGGLLTSAVHCQYTCDIAQ